LQAHHNNSDLNRVQLALFHGPITMPEAHAGANNKALQRALIFVTSPEDQQVYVVLHSAIVPDIIALPKLGAV
jgi:hypothetical protein